MRLALAIALPLAAAEGVAHAGCRGPTEDALQAWPDGRSPPPHLRTRPSPALAASLSVVPGLGHAYLCDWQGAWVAPASVFGGVAGAAVLLLDDSPADDPFATPAIYFSQNAWFYGIYDGWRVARLARGPREGRLPVDGARPLDHLAAPFRPDSLKDPWVIGAAGLGAALLVGEYAWTGGPVQPVWRRRTVPWAGEPIPVGTGLVLGELVWGGTFAGVGVGEEALFRGVVQPTLVEWSGPVPGVLAQAAIFGALHYPNAGGDVEQGLYTVAITGTVALGLGYLAHRDQYELRRPIAAHFWYDMAIGTAAFLLDPEGMPWAVSYEGPF